MQSDDKVLLSEYNEAGYQILRLHEIWIGCHNAIKNGNFQLWNTKLDSAWTELAADAKQKDETYYYKRYNLLNKLIKTYISDKNKLYFFLQKKMIFLKCLQEDVGKGGKKSKHYDDMI